MPSFYIENFGCRASQADGAALYRQLASRGIIPGLADVADYVILNTCTVTATADQEARAALRRIRRRNPEARILVTGCYAQRAPAEVAALPGVAWVAGNSHKHRIADILASSQEVASEAASNVASVTPPTSGFVPLSTLHPQPIIHIGDIFAHTELLAAPVFGPGDDHTRPILKVQDGCDNRCSFCVIPSVRGQSRSRHLTDVISDIHALVTAGYQEVVLSGINLGRWGRDLSPCSHFEALVEAILEQTSLPKLRISSVEPMDWSRRLIALIGASPRIAKHAHVPLQSGSDSVLRRMHRKYRPWHYREKIEQIRAAMPTAAIGADVMVGFPGETDAEFDETRRLIEVLPFTYLHLFPFSARPGTPAAIAADPVPAHLTHDRIAILREIIAAKKLAFARSFVGQTLSAITLRPPARELLYPEATSTPAISDNYLKLRLTGSYPANQWLQVHIIREAEGVLTATSLPKPPTCYTLEAFQSCTGG